MHVSFTCPHCRHALRAAAQNAGRTTRCLKCGQPLQVPAADATALPMPDPGSEPTYGLDPLADDLPPLGPTWGPAPRNAPQAEDERRPDLALRELAPRELALFGGVAGMGLLSVAVLVWVVLRSVSSLPDWPAATASTATPSAGAGTPASAPENSAFAAALAESEPEERPYLEAAHPMLTALARRDYTTLYTFLSSHARSEAVGEQFVPDTGAAAPPSPEKIVPLTAEAFQAWMAKMEAVLGVPQAVDHLYVQELDPAVLAGRGDRFDVMLSIGGMPAGIPASIRRASIRTAIRCQLTPQMAAEIAAARGISVQQLLTELDEGEHPYFNLKFVLVEEAGTLKIGYFEFMPPSILD